MSAEGVPVAASIDGQDGKSWRLPLPPLGPKTLPEPFSLGEHPERDRLQAAAKMVGKQLISGRDNQIELLYWLPELKHPLSTP